MWLYSLAAVLVVSAVSLVGVCTLALSGRRLQRVLAVLVSFAAGALFGDAFIHLLPETFREHSGQVQGSLLVIAGVLLFFILEKFLRWRHCHVVAHQEDHRTHPLAAMNLIGDAVHNLIDGVLIAASFSESASLGMATTIAVVLHEIPQEIGDFGVLVHGGLSVRRALLFNFLCGLTAVAGAAISLALGRYVAGYATALLPITAGGFIYIAGSDLIPELQHDTEPARSCAQLAGIAAGVAVMAALTLVD
ncbi:ZIP family metal transporter [bacterium]|nr:ZIP family metal transporter [bacterium]